MSDFKPGDVVVIGGHNSEGGVMPKWAGFRAAVVRDKESPWGDPGVWLVPLQDRPDGARLAEFGWAATDLTLEVDI